jgi:hypothetical protein
MKTRELVVTQLRGFRAVLRLIVFGSIVLLGLTLAAHAKDKNECTQESLKGSYGFVLQGLQFPSPPSAVGAVPVSAAGVMVFDGNGSLAAQDTFNNGVTIAHRTGTGTYTVDVDCTGSAALGGDFAGLSFYYVIVSRGREFAFVITNPGTDQPGVAVTTGDEECALASFKGTYVNTRLDYRAIGFFSTVNIGLEVANVDGNGHISFPPVVQSLNGVFSYPTATGTYTVSSNCIIAMDLLIVDGATAVRRRREGVVVDGGKQVWFTSANIPSTNAGTARFKRLSRHDGDERGHDEGD